MRSFRGAKGRWYRDLAGGGPATLEADGRAVAVQAVPAHDAASTERASAAFLAKYRPSSYAEAMVKPAIETRKVSLRPTRVDSQPDSGVMIAEAMM